MDRVLLFTPIYPPTRGGASLHYENLVKRIGRNYHMTVLTQYTSHSSLVTHENGTTIYRVVPRLRYLPLPIRLLIVPGIAMVFSVFIQLTQRVSVVHSHSTSVSAIGIGLSTYFTGTPLIYDCRDEDFPRPVIKIGRVKEYLSCSSNIDHYLKSAGIPSNRIHRASVVSPDYVSDYVKVSHRSDVFTVVFVGAVRKDKGAPAAIEAFKRFTEDVSGQVRMIVIGDGPCQERLKERVARQRLDGLISFTGSIPHKAVLEKVSKSNVLVLPSRSEGIPRVILEAFELGIPVVASSSGGITDVVKDEETGLLAGTDPESVALALKRLYSSAELRQSISDNGQKFVQNRDFELVAKQVSHAYESACG